VCGWADTCSGVEGTDGADAAIGSNIGCDCGCEAPGGKEAEVGRGF
jgi:hypothetical protein